MTAKEALESISKRLADVPYQEEITMLNQALEELEAIKSANGANEYSIDIVEVLDHIEVAQSTTSEMRKQTSLYFIKKYILKSQAQEKELAELKATIKELLDIPITVSTFNGTSLLVKTINKLNKLVGEN